MSAFSSEPQATAQRAVRDFARGAGGALVFSLPILMTMELWALGAYLERVRLLVLLAVALPVLVLLSRQVGFERTRRWRDDFLDAGIAIGISAFVCGTSLALFGTLTAETPIDEAIGAVVVQMVPASIGALLARSQFGAREEADAAPAGREENYGGELFLMAVGALFLGFNVAPTEEMLLISYQMTPWQAFALVTLSLGIMHGFVFAVGFAGGSEISPRDPWWSPLVRMTLPGYVVAFAISLGLLWVFGRSEGLAFEGMAMAGVVLGFPSAIGAASARLIL